MKMNQWQIPLMEQKEDDALLQRHVGSFHLPRCLNGYFDSSVSAPNDGIQLDVLYQSLFSRLNLVRNFISSHAMGLLWAEYYHINKLIHA